ncbi:hypothetical protein ANO14919_085440 [Xylariales sp. No.14919]|nr:hypothetical protein ANO14919_085440 [Xylariales sp. No.14919]
MMCLVALLNDGVVQYLPGSSHSRKTVIPVKAALKTWLFTPIHKTRGFGDDVIGALDLVWRSIFMLLA